MEEASFDIKKEYTEYSDFYFENGANIVSGVITNDKPKKHKNNKKPYIKKSRTMPHMKMHHVAHSTEDDTQITPQSYFMTVPNRPIEIPPFTRQLFSTTGSLSNNEDCEAFEFEIQDVVSQSSSRDLLNLKVMKKPKNKDIWYEHFEPKIK